MKFSQTHWLAVSVSFLFMLASGAALAASPLQVPDTLEQRLAACAHCHGEYGMGNESNPRIPRLAEKPAGYLYKQLQTYKDRQGLSSAMEYVVRQLSPEYLRKIAQYYSEQRVPYHPQAVPELAPEVLARGELLVKEGDPARGVPACQHCHGQALTGVKPMIPGVLNQPFDYVKAQLELWRANKRSTESTHCMWVVANRMLPTDVDAVSAWLALQEPPANREPIAEHELPEALPGWCTLGHGVNL